MKLYHADCRGNARNCLYPHEVNVSDADSLKAAVSQDYVAVAYQHGYRSKDHFLRTDCLALDCDNDDSDKPSDWITPEAIIRSFPDVRIAFHFSRNHMKEKHGKSPRPRFHCFFLIDETTDPDVYRSLKQRMNQLCPYFDIRALDAARFFFGTEQPEVLYHQGSITLNACLDLYYPEEPDDFAAMATGLIPEGSRNATLSRFAGRLLKRLGEGEKAYHSFLVRARACSPPLDEAELEAIWNSAIKFYRKIATDPDYVKPDSFGQQVSRWEDPIPFSRRSSAPFPLDALPADIAAYVKSVAESTQTPVDMAGTVALSVMAVCLQSKYVVAGSTDWREPLNLYSLVIATPSERKSAVLSAMMRPINEYEEQYNLLHAGDVESSRMHRRILERKQRTVEDLYAKGKASQDDVEQIAREIASFEDVEPLQLYVDDVTTEKLVSVLSANHGHAALISSEGGIFDTLAGIYTKNVNIDVMLKAYSGDSIRVDRIGRDSESISHPALTLLLMAQPSVVSAVLSNTVFRGRGLTARILYCLPDSMVGKRSYNASSISPDIYRAYQQKIINLLEDEYPKIPETITLSSEAREAMISWANEVEGKLITEYAEIADWAGKLVGNTLRIAGLLCRASVIRGHEFLDAAEYLIIEKPIMEAAIKLARYFVSHALCCFDCMPTDAIVNQAKQILQLIAQKKLKEVDRRTVMRYRKAFKTAAEVQPVLDFLEDYGYLVQQDQVYGRIGRPQNVKYLVNEKGVLSISS